VIPSAPLIYQTMQWKYEQEKKEKEKDDIGLTSYSIGG